MHKKGDLDSIPITSQVAATSVGIVNGIPMLDLCYNEDSNAEVDFNVVMTDKGEYVEVQGTGEGSTFSKDEMQKLLNIAEKGIKELFKLQKDATDAAE